MKQKQKEYCKNRYNRLMVEVKQVVQNGEQNGIGGSIRRPISIYFYVKLYVIFVYNNFFIMNNVLKLFLLYDLTG